MTNKTARHRKGIFKSTFVALAIAPGIVFVNAAQAQTAAPQSPQAVVAAEASALSLVEVLAYALDHNPQRQAAWSAARAAKARIGTAKADGGLQVGLTGNASNQWGFGKVGSFVPGGGGGLSLSSSSQGWRESLAVDATLPLYTGGRVKGNKKVATYNFQIAVAQAISTEQNLVFSATLGYLDILRNEQLVDVGQANLDVARERHRIAKVRFDAGAAARLDVLRAATDEATAEQNLVAARNALDQSRATLNTIMGRRPQTPLRVQPLDQLTLPAAFSASAEDNAPTALSAPRAAGSTNVPNNNVNNNINNAVNNAGNAATNAAQAPAGSRPSPDNSFNMTSGAQLATLAAGNSPTLAALEAQLHAAEAAVDVAKAGRKPSVGISLTGLISNPVSFLGRFLVSLGGSVVQKLFDSGRTSSEVQAARATVDQLKSSLSAGELSVANQIEQSLLALNSARERESTAQTAVVSAQEALRSAQLGYAAGVQTALDVSDAEAALLTAQTNAVNARFDVAASQAQLAAAVGVLTVEGESAYQESDAGQAYRKIADQKTK